MTTLRRALFVALPLLALGGGLFACGLGVPGYRGPVSGHFDGTRFHNVPRTNNPGAKELLRWRSHREHAAWGPRRLTAPAGPRPFARVTGSVLRVTFIGHATMLVQTAGLNLLTDPVFSERLGPLPVLTPMRHRPPGVRFEDLPPIDAVFVSHDHYDHLDLPSLRRLARAHHPRIFAGLGTGAFLKSEGIPGGEDLDWWQGAALGPGVTLAAVPAQHSSRRGVDDMDRALWAGFVLSTPGGAVFFAGDTGFGPHFQQIRERYGPMRLALLPIGAYRPRWFMRPLHMDPAEAVATHRILGAKTSVAMHFGTFDLADEGELEPVAELKKHAGDEPFWVLGFGEGREIP